MKPIYSVALFLCLILSSSLSFGAILTVDNTPGNNAMYDSFSEARDAANEGDTIIVQPSSSSYGNLDITKSLVVLGFGHGGNPIQERRSRIGYLRVSANNVVVAGFFISNLSGGACGTPFNVDPSLNSINGQNIRISNCLIKNSFAISNGTVNVIFEGCILGFENPALETLGLKDSNTCLIFDEEATTASSVSYLNNIILARYIRSSNNSWLFSNNIFYLSSGNSIFQCSEMTFNSNIFYVELAVAWEPDNCEGCSFASNLIYSPEADLEELPNSDLNNIEPTWVLDENAESFFWFDSNYDMLSGTPAGGGTDGGPIGIYGNNYSFRKNGAPQGLPRVNALTLLNPVLNLGEELEIQVEAQGDNE